MTEKFLLQVTRQTLLLWNGPYNILILLILISLKVCRIFFLLHYGLSNDWNFLEKAKAYWQNILKHKQNELFSRCWSSLFKPSESYRCWPSACTVHGARHADTQTHICTVAASTRRCLTRSCLSHALTPPCLLSCSRLQLHSLSLSLSHRCCFVWFKSVLKCFRMFSFMQICGCGVWCAAAYLTIVFVFYFLSYWIVYFMSFFHF